jgi:NAD(P)H dehydrogenase (quinone)
MLMLVLAHPDPASFNAAIAQRCHRALEGVGHDVRFHDLHAEGFDPVLPAGEIPRDAALDAVVARHVEELAQAHGVIVIHPNWWGMPPAILKGWVDRVFRPGVAYEFVEGDSGEGVPRGLLKARAAVVLNTSNTAVERENRDFGDPLERIWKDCIFGLCGITDVRRRMFETIVTSTLPQREAWLDEAEVLVLEAFGRS